MRDARQRAILAGLGIPLWIPRLLGTRKQPISPAIWRDQITPDQPLISPHQPEALLSPQQEPPVAALEVQLSEVQQAEPEQPASALNITVNKPVLATGLLPAVSDALHSADIVSNQALLRFSVQAVEVNHWVLLVDEQTLQNAAAKQLWGNICAAFGNPEQLRFNWPLADGLRWQHPQGAKAALNGFLFRLGMDKRVGLMGELQDNVMPDRIERLPTLQELIEQPLKKRSLWQLLKQQ